MADELAALFRDENDRSSVSSFGGDEILQPSASPNTNSRPSSARPVSAFKPGSDELPDLVRRLVDMNRAKTESHSSNQCVVAGAVFMKSPPSTLRSSTRQEFVDLVMEFCAPHRPHTDTTSSQRTHSRLDTTNKSGGKAWLGNASMHRRTRRPGSTPTQLDLPDELHHTTRSQALRETARLHPFADEDELHDSLLQSNTSTSSFSARRRWLRNSESNADDIDATKPHACATTPKSVASLMMAQEDSSLDAQHIATDSTGGVVKTWFDSDCWRVSRESATDRRIAKARLPGPLSVLFLFFARTTDPATGEKRRAKYNAIRDPATNIAFVDFLKFAEYFGLFRMGLERAQIAHLFRQAAGLGKRPKDVVRSISFSQFVELLGRIAVVIFSHPSHHDSFPTAMEQVQTLIRETELDSLEAIQARLASYQPPQIEMTESEYALSRKGLRPMSAKPEARKQKAEVMRVSTSKPVSGSKARPQSATTLPRTLGRQSAAYATMHRGRGASMHHPRPLSESQSDATLGFSKSTPNSPRKRTPQSYALTGVPSDRDLAANIRKVRKQWAGREDQIDLDVQRYRSSQSKNNLQHFFDAKQLTQLMQRPDPNFGLKTLPEEAMAKFDLGCLGPLKQCIALVSKPKRLEFDGPFLDLGVVCSGHEYQFGIAVLNTCGVLCDVQISCEDIPFLLFEFPALHGGLAPGLTCTIKGKVPAQFALDNRLCIRYEPREWFGRVNIRLSPKSQPGLVVASFAVPVFVNVTNSAEQVRMPAPSPPGYHSAHSSIPFTKFFSSEVLSKSLRRTNVSNVVG